MDFGRPAKICEDHRVDAVGNVLPVLKGDEHFEQTLLLKIGRVKRCFFITGKNENDSGSDNKKPSDPRCSHKMAQSFYGTVDG